MMQQSYRLLFQPRNPPFLQPKSLYMGQPVGLGAIYVRNSMGNHFEVMSCTKGYILPIGTGSFSFAAHLVRIVHQ